jgi:OmpA-OmpF porin, OOP family
MRSKNIFAAAACLGLGSFTAAVPASAAQFGLYVGAHYGDAKKDVEQGPFDDFALVIAEDLEFIPLQTSTQFENKDSGYGFLVGYRLTPYLAVEGNYIDLGKVTYKNSSTGTFEGEPVALGTNFTSNTTGLGVSVLGILPISFRWEAYGRAGVLIATNDLDIFLTDGVGRASDSISEGSTDLFGGVGLSFSFAEIYQARLEFQRFFDSGDEVTGEGDVDLISLGITVTF